jgi:hypothetical protein
MRVLAVCLSAILITACRHQPLAYTLVPKGPQIILNPPIPPAPELVLPHARQSQKPGCDIGGDWITLRWTGKTARIRMAPSDGDPGGPDRMFTDTLKSIEAFRADLFANVDQGCLTASERSRLVVAITERFALPPNTAYNLRFGAFAQTGFVELTPDFRLKVVSPLPSDGVEVAFYSITAAPKDDRMRIAVDSFTTNPAGAPPIAPLTLPSSANYFRALFWTARSSTNHYATILAAENRPALDAATQAFQAQPDGSCRTSLGAGVTCVPVPLQWAVNAELRVRVNGSDAYVTIGGTVSQVAANQSHVTVMRMFNGRLIPVKGENLMRLVLMPGDQITYP